MKLERRDKELAAIGASIGCNCRPCIEHHVRAVVETSTAHALAALGASVGANSHALLEHHIAAALELGLSPREVATATKVAGYVQRRTSEMTAAKAAQTLEQLAGAATGMKEETPLAHV